MHWPSPAPWHCKGPCTPGADQPSAPPTPPSVPAILKANAFPPKVGVQSLPNPRDIALFLSPPRGSLWGSRSAPPQALRCQARWGAPPSPCWLLLAGSPSPSYLSLLWLPLPAAGPPTSLSRSASRSRSFSSCSRWSSSWCGRLRSEGPGEAAGCTSPFRLMSLAERCRGRGEARPLGPASRRRFA